MINTNSGRFFVIEGTDGSGKATQTRLLMQALRRMGRSVRTIAFPQYGQSSAVPIEAYLRGEYGGLHALGPYQASLLYAIDRAAARTKMQQWLDDGRVVVADRFMASNLAHQGAKIPNAAARRKFWRWDADLEFGLLKLPRPNRTIVLLVPPQVSQRLILLKQQRGYLKTKKRDIHEADVHYQERVAKAYVDLAKDDARLSVINCAPAGQLLPISEIHQLVMGVVAHNLKR